MKAKIVFGMFGVMMLALGLLAGVALDSKISMVTYGVLLGVFTVLQFASVIIDRREHSRFMDDMDIADAALDAQRDEFTRMLFATLSARGVPVIGEPSVRMSGDELSEALHDYVRKREVH